MHELPAEDKSCSQCGCAKSALGHDEREILEYLPARFIVCEHRMEKYACGYCKDGVVTAPGPSGAIGELSASPSLLAHVVTSKYADHCPLISGSIM